MHILLVADSTKAEGAIMYCPSRLLCGFCLVASLACPDQGVRTDAGAFDNAVVSDANSLTDRQNIADVSPSDSGHGDVSSADNAGTDTAGGTDAVSGVDRHSGQNECNDGIDNDGDGLIDWQYDLGCANANDDDEAATSRDLEDGFSTFDPSPSSHIIYVSSSAGDDDNNGETPALAVQTLARGAALVRDGANDFLLLRRGDTWRDQSLGRFKSGQDQQHPLLVASYGDSMQRPRIEISGQFIDHNGDSRSYVAVLGIEIVPYPKIPGDSAFDGASGGAFRYVGGGTGLLIEDCHILYGELVVQSYGDFHYDGVEIRRNIIERSYHVNTCGQNNAFRPSGMYASHVDNLLIEDNVFDHNGWNEDVTSACATMYNHNLYLNAEGLIIRGNIIARASSSGIKMRSDSAGDASELLIEDNVLVDGEVGISIGGNTTEPGRFVNASIRNNVFSQIGMGNPTERSFSWMLGVQDNVQSSIENNLFVHQPWYSNAFGILLSGDSNRDINVVGNLFYDLRARSLEVRANAGFNNVEVRENLIVDPTHSSCLVDHTGAFTNVSYTNNSYFSSAASEWFCIDDVRQSLSQWQANSGESGAAPFTGTFADPARTVASYAASLGYDASLEAFLEEARSHSRLDWQAQLSARAVNAYIRAGFEH